MGVNFYYTLITWSCQNLFFGISLSLFLSLTSEEATTVFHFLRGFRGSFAGSARSSVHSLHV